MFLSFVKRLPQGNSLSLNLLIYRVNMSNEEKTKSQRIVSWFSAGVSSAVATKLALKENDIKIIYIDVDDQHEDSIRFVRDCEKWFGQSIKILKSKYKSVDNVCKTFQFINSAYGAKCTGILKKRVRQEWELKNKADVYVWGMDASRREVLRANRIIEIMPEFRHRFPLIEKSLTKEEAHGILRKVGIKRPIMYDLGYPNNNCIGCVKGGKGYWNKIKKDFPEIFRQRSEMERKVGHSCIKGIFLDELDEDSGRKQKIICDDCGIFCQIEFNEI